MAKNKKTFNHQDSVIYLLKEYELSASDVQHHDKLQIDVMKFAYSFYIAFFTILIAIYEKFYRDVIWELFLLFFAGFIIGLTFLFFMIRNRAHFIRSNRQVVSLRRFFMNNLELNFRPNNSLYINPLKIKYFKIASIYTFSILSIIIFNAILATGSFLFLWEFLIGFNLNILSFSTLLFYVLFVSIGQFYLMILYLNSKEKIKT